MAIFFSGARTTFVTLMKVWEEKDNLKGKALPEPQRQTKGGLLMISVNFIAFLFHWRNEH